MADKRLLLVLDNLEHLPETAPQIADLVAACPRLGVITTSRQRLHIAAEREYVVPPVSECEAAALFADRSSSRDDEDVVLDICRHVGCLPLAIELAAAHTKALSTTEILLRLQDRELALTGGDWLSSVDTNWRVTIPEEPTLAYGRQWSSGNFVCWSEFEGGVYCRSLFTRHGFKIDRDGISDRIWGSRVLILGGGWNTIPGGSGYPVLCADGSTSYSGGIQGACSWHGGEAG